MESLEVVIPSEDPEIFKSRRDAIQEEMTSIEKSLRRLLARRASKFEQGKLPRLQVPNDHGSLKFQSEGEKIHEVHDSMDDDIEEEPPEFLEEMKLTCDVKNAFCESLQLYVDYEESYEI